MALLYCILLIINNIPPYKIASKLQAPKTEIKYSNL